jgi:hypothetical protein
LSEINNHNFYTSTKINYHQETTPNIISQNFYQCRKTHCPTAAQTETRYRQIREDAHRLTYAEEGTSISSKTQHQMSLYNQALQVYKHIKKGTKKQQYQDSTLLRPTRTPSEQDTKQNSKLITL